ncbi:MAG: DUF1622 domain-containing protein [Angustibacter sp.]
MHSAVTLISDDWLRAGVDALVVLVEAAGALVIVAGALLAFLRFLKVLPRRSADAFVPVRLTLGRFLALGLEFQLASDVLRTAIAPSFQELGKLAAVAAIRTALNFFLAREIREEQDVIRGEGGPQDAGQAVAAGPSVTHRPDVTRPQP